MLTLERRINETALESDLRGLREVLSEYRELILSVTMEFKVKHERKGQAALDLQSRKEMK